MFRWTVHTIPRFRTVCGGYLGFNLVFVSPFGPYPAKKPRYGFTPGHCSWLTREVLRSTREASQRYARIRTGMGLSVCYPKHQIITFAQHEIITFAQRYLITLAHC